MLYLVSEQEGVIPLEEKKRHSTAANVLYLLRHVAKVDRTYLPALAAALAVKLVLPVVATLLPTAAVAALTQGGSMGQYLAAILGLMALYALGTVRGGGSPLDEGPCARSVIVCFWWSGMPWLMPCW